MKGSRLLRVALGAGCLACGSPAAGQSPAGGVKEVPVVWARPGAAAPAPDAPPVVVREAAPASLPAPPQPAAPPAPALRFNGDIDPTHRAGSGDPAPAAVTPTKPTGAPDAQRASLPVVPVAAQQPAPLPAAPAPDPAPQPPVSDAAGTVRTPPQPQTPAGPRWQTPPPRLGLFVVQPTGPGYYTLLDQLRGDSRENPPKYPYPRVSPFIFSNYDVNWSYLKDPNNTEHDYADFLKWIPVADNVTFTTGGEYRYRFMNEVNSNGRLSGQPDAYSLFRLRVYGDLWVEDWLRVFGEFLYADFAGRTLTPLATDADRGDILNLFADVRLFRFGEADNPVYFRAGRQELLYGSQRLVSPLDWVNTRRTFQGFKAFTRTKDWDFDAFAVQPVVPQAGRFDSVDDKQWFSGAWFTYRTAPGQNIDLYYLNLNNTNANAALGQRGAPGSYNVGTFGARYVGAKNGWLWDAEGMLQTGYYSNQSVVAKAFSASGGYEFQELRWRPQLWAGYDYASGDPDPQNTATRRTFNQLFPFGHYYLGFADVVGRQNINDYYAQAVAFPEKWLMLLAQFHVFRLDSDKDALYGPGGNVIRQDRTGRAGNDVGNELDLLTNFHLTNHSDVLVGYSILFAGSFIKNTAPPGPNRDAFSANPQLFYLQYSYRW